MAANELIPYYKPGQDITCQATAAIVGKKFVKISGNRVSGPGLASTSDGANYRVATASAAGRAFGVSKYDAASGAKVGVATAGVVPVTAGAAITAFDEVEIDATGRAITCASGIAVGVALTAASAADVDAEILLYGSPTIGLPDTGNSYAQGTPQANIVAVATTTAKTSVGTTAAATAVTAATVATANGSDAATTQALANQLKVDFNLMVTDMANARTTIEALRVDLNKAEDDLTAAYARLDADKTAINTVLVVLDEYGQTL